MLSMLWQPEQKVVISEPDIQAAIEHLRTLPFNSMPKSWDRQWLLSSVREAVKGRRNKSVGAKTCMAIASGLWAIVVPFGADLANRASKVDDRLQVWLLIRPVGTDQKSITEL